MHHFIRFKTRLGPFWICENGAGVTHMQFGAPLPIPEAKEGETELLLEAKKQLLAYLDGQSQSFDLPIDPRGTAFQQQCWAALRQIPRGETRTYAQVADMVGRPKAARAVGLANNKNPLHVLTPCHRVIGANGDLVGYAAGLPIKQALLDLETSP